MPHMLGVPAFQVGDPVTFVVLMKAYHPPFHSRERLHARRPATIAGTAKTRRNIGASSATEYPALVTPTYMLMPAPMSHTGMNHRAAVTTPAVGAPAPRSRPAIRKRLSRRSPPAITFMVWEMVASGVTRESYLGLAMSRMK